VVWALWKILTDLLVGFGHFLLLGLLFRLLGELLLTLLPVILYDAII
jgi:hypothetical protein